MASLFIWGCADQASTAFPVAPTLDIIALAGGTSAMGITPRDLGSANVSGEGAAVCNSAPVRGADEPGGGTTRTWLGEKVKNPARTFVVGGFLVTMSPDKRSLGWTSVASGDYPGTSHVMTAILVKAGTSSSLYHYNPYFTSDADGVPPNTGAPTTSSSATVVRADAGLSALQQGIGHIVVCYVERLFEASVTVELTASPIANVGSPVEYRATARNTSPPGTPDLDCVMTFLRAGPMGNLTDFAPGASAVFATTITALSEVGPYVETATLSCTLPNVAGEITASASATTLIYQLAITFTKSGPATASVGDEVTYTFLLVNTGTPGGPALECTITDQLTNFDSQVTLAPGEGTSPTSSYVVQATDVGTLINTARAECTDPFGATIWVLDDHEIAVQPASDRVRRPVGRVTASSPRDRATPHNEDPHATRRAADRP